MDGKKEALALSKEEYAKAVELGRASFGEPKEFSRDHPVKGIIQAGNKAYLIYNANPTYSANDLVSEYDLADLEKGAAALRGIMEEYNRVNGTAFTIAISPAAFLKMINNRRMDIDGMFYVFSSPAQSLPAINRDIAAFNQAKKADMPPLTEAKLQSLRQEGTLKTPDWVFAMDGGKVIARQEKRSKTTDLTIYADAKGKPDNADIWEYYLYDGWLDYLHDSKEFQGEYSKIDWNGVEMRSVMEAYIQKMAKQGVAGNADGKGTAPKSDWFEPAEPQLAPGENKK